MSKLKKTDPKEKKVTLAQYRDNFVTLYGTEKNPYHETGKPFQIHPDQAKLLISKGFATEEAPADAENAKDQNGGEGEDE